MKTFTRITLIIIAFFFAKWSWAQSGCIQSTPYFESFSTNSGGWTPPTSFFNSGTINGCWNRTVTNYVWVKAPTVTGANNNSTGPLGDRQNGGNSYISADEYNFFTLDTETTIETPPISLVNDTAPELCFWYHMFGSDIIELRIDAQIGSDTNWNSIDTLKANSGAFVSQSSPWLQACYPLDSLVDDTVKFRFTSVRVISALSNGINCRTSLDDIRVEEWDGSCRTPVDLRILSAGLTSAQVGWKTNDAQATYQVQFTSGQASPAGGASAITTIPTYTLTGLSPNSFYTLRVRSICAAGDTSDWSGFITIRTDCGVFTAPWSEDFEGNSWVVSGSFSQPGIFDPCFTSTGEVLHFWRVYDTKYTTNSGPNNDHTPTGPGRYLAINHRSTLSLSTTKPEVITPWVDLDSLVVPELRFWVHAYSNQTQFGNFSVIVETLGGATSTVLDTSGSFQSSQAAAWKQLIINLSQYSSQTVRVIFLYEAVQANNFQEFSIDDIEIAESLNCPTVVASGTVSINGSTASAQSTGDSTHTILWVWGDGNSTTGATATYTYPIPGVYTVLQIATNYCGAADTVATTLTACGAVDAVFTSTSNGLTTTFDGSASTGAAPSYSWDYGDGNTAFGANPTHTYATAGTYTVSLTVTDACGTNDVTSSTVQVCPIVNLGIASTVNGNTFTFSATPANLSAYNWDFGDGTTGTGPQISHTYSGTGNYSVVLSALDSCSTIWSDTIEVSTCAPLTGNFTFSIVSAGSNGMLVQFFANVSGATGLIWNWGDGTQNITQATSISHQYPTTSLSYIITLSLLNDCGDTLNITRTLNEVTLNEYLSAKTLLYPNPVSGSSVSIDLAAPLTNGIYSLVDIMGRVVEQGPISSTTPKIFVDHLQAGFYIIRLTDGTNQLQKSFIKTH